MREWFRFTLVSELIQPGLVKELGLFKAVDIVPLYFKCRSYTEKRCVVYLFAEILFTVYSQQKAHNSRLEH